MSAAMRVRGLLVAGVGTLVVGLALARYPAQIPLPESLAAPDAGRAAAALRALAALAVLNLAAWGPGRRLAAALRPAGRDPLQGALGLALGLQLLGWGVLGLAAAGRLGPGWLGAGLGAAALTGLPPLWRRVRAGPARARPRTLAGAAGAVLLGLPAVLTALGPDPGWDAATYHLALPERYLHAGTLVVTPLSVFSAFPLAVEMLYLLLLAGGAPAAAGLLHLELGVLTAVCAVHLARRSSPRAGWLVLAVLAADPLFLWELGRAYNDLAACLYTLLAAAAFAEAREGRPRADWLCGVCAGAAAAVRYPAWTLVPALLALSALAPGMGGAASRLRSAAAIAGGAAAAAAPWLLRNAVWIGNPFAPALQGWFHAPGAEFFDPRALEQNADLLRAIGFGRDLGALLALPWNLTLRAVPGDYLAFGYRVGPLYGVGLAAALLAGPRGRPPLARVLLALAGLLTLLWFATTQEPRYLLPALVLVAVAGAIAADALLPSRGAGLAALALPAVAVLHAQVSWLGALPGAWNRALGPPLPPAAREPAAVVGERLRGALASDERLLLLFEPRGWHFRGLDYVPYHLNDGSPLLHRLHAAASQRRLGALFEELGATHVLVNWDLATRLLPRFVAGYSAADFDRDRLALRVHLERRGRRLVEERGVEVWRLERPGGDRSRRSEPAPSDRPGSARAAGPPARSPD